MIYKIKPSSLSILKNSGHQHSASTTFAFHRISGEYLMRQKMELPTTIIVAVLAIGRSAYAVGLSGADTAIYNYLWYIANFAAGVTAVVLLAKMFIALGNTEDKGQIFKQAVVNLMILGVVWGLGSAILSYADQSGTSMNGVSQALSFKH
jgi:hypothetical protein